MSGDEAQPGIEWHEARRRAAAVASTPDVAVVGLAESIGLVLAGDIVARQSIPHFASSAMDGWAVVGQAPWMMAIPGEIAPHTAWSVVTGQQLPTGIRGVLRSEHGTETDGILRTNSRAAPNEPTTGQHVRKPSTEARRGETVVHAGCVINPAHVALAAACGLDELCVHPRPVVSILTTGDEVTVSGLPAPGSVRDSFGPQLPAVVAMLGGTAVSIGRVSDDDDATVSAITEAAARSRVVITTGGTGRSGADHLRASLARLDVSIVIPSIAMRPGAPTMLGRLPGGQLVVCLPGNPLAALMGLLSIGAPAIAVLAGRAQPPRLRVRLASGIAGSSRASALVPCSIDSGVATPLAWTGSAMMRGLASADAVLIVPPGGSPADGAVEALPLPWTS